MHPRMVDVIVDCCKQREREGDHPTVAAFSVEQLEGCVLMLATMKTRLEADRDRLRAELEGVRANHERYLIARDDPRFDIRIIGVGKRSGAELDAAIDAARAPQPSGDNRE